MIALRQGAMWVACAIAFISWMHRAYSNFDALPNAHRRWATGWSIGAWFVPILNAFRPKQIINDIWRSGRPTGGGRRG
jgi:eukaryotic-like serine/threonine-protein kinase